MERPSEADGPVPEISIVSTVLNEKKGIRDLIDSLVLQRPRHEVVIVDAGSTDGTWEILKRYADEFPQVRPFQYKGKRGAGRNAGVRLSRADKIAFIDGDCIANAFWLERLLEGFAGGADIVAGHTSYTGYWAFTNMRRVELPHHGQDTTWPSCNLAYRKDVFLEVGGFDERFVTAEDIDLNFRAIDAGHRLVHDPKALVYARARDSVKGFLTQAYWNGYGRKQLTLKHGGLWHEYSFGEMLRAQRGFWSRARMSWAVQGYLACKLKESAADYRDEHDRPTTANAALTGDYGDDHPAPRPARKPGSALGAP